MNEVDSEELSKTWDEIAKIWDVLPSQSPNRVIEHFHDRVDEFIVKMFSNWFGMDSKNALDLGCGDGELLRRMSDSHFSVLRDLLTKTYKKEELVFIDGCPTFFGADISREMLRRAEKKTKGSVVFHLTDKRPEIERKMKKLPRFRFLEYDLRFGTPIRKEEIFDFVMMTANIIGNIESPSTLLKHTYKILRRPGYLIIGSYNPEFMTERFVNSYYGRLPRQFEILSFNTEEHTVSYSKPRGLFSKWYSKEELSELLSEAGFNNYRTKQEGIGFVTMVKKPFEL